MVGAFDPGAALRLGGNRHRILGRLTVKRPEIIAIPVGSVEVQLYTNNDRICSSIMKGVPFEPESLEVWGDICGAGGRVMDIGAYSGLYAIAASMMGCHATAFEPLPDNRVRFKKNAALNGVDVKVNMEAVADRVGVLSLSVNPAVKGMTSGASLLRYSGGAPGAREIRFPVPALTIDSLGLKKLDAMKIDVERAEPMVLAGAQETLRRLRPVLLVEVLGDAEKAAVRAAVPKSYRVKRELDGRNWLMVAR